MGTGYDCKCNKCEYGFIVKLGIGFLSPKVYKSIVSAMKAVKLGEQPKSFFVEHPDGAVNCETVVACCEKCGKYFPVKSFDMYVPKDIEDSNRDYVMPNELGERYILHQRYEHKCPECGGDAFIVDDFEEKLSLGKIKCLQCDDGIIVPIEEMMWD